MVGNAHTRGYFDDSGTDAANPALVVAGFVSTAEQWDRLDVEWRATLEEFEVIGFHAKEFDRARRGFGPYADSDSWNDSKRREFYNRLLGIILRRTRRSIGSVVHKTAYADVIESNADLRRYFGSPYAFSCFNCIFAAEEWRNGYEPKQSLLVVFDEGHANAGEAMRSRDHLKKAGDRFIFDLETGDDEKIVPLQAADLLVFELCSEARRRLSNSRR